MRRPSSHFPYISLVFSKFQRREQGTASAGTGIGIPDAKNGSVPGNADASPMNNHQTMETKMKTTQMILSLAAGIGLVLQANAQDPYEQPDDTYISLSGTVTSSTPSSFVLDYGEGLVTVEMDDWDWYGDAYGILPEDEVTVYGYVDDDLFETTSIEASSVWVEDLNTYFYASGADEEGVGEIKPYPYMGTVWYDYDYTVTGTVTSVQEDIREFTIDTGTREVSVDTWQLGYNPIDDEGFLQIEEGDRVTVYGDLDLDAFDEREISAEALVKLQPDVGRGEAL